MASAIDQFFKEIKKPTNYDMTIENVQTFIKYCISRNLDIVLLSSGGTTVPLESKTVRFIDNFSIGTRGATSAEHFLHNDYAVVFLHRKGSLEPYRRHFMNMNFLDLLENDNSGTLKVKEDAKPHVGEVLAKYEEVKRKGSLLKVEFTTLHDYLHLLRGISETLNPYEKKVVFYLAAAVSDFFIPSSDMPEHKIQSSDGPLNLTLHLVPKLLEPLVADWAPKAFIVSFKLETNPEILISKARGALERYKHELVIANQLETRKREVVMVTNNDSKPIILTDEQVENGVEIEEFIISDLIERHSKFKES